VTMDIRPAEKMIVFVKRQATHYASKPASLPYGALNR
jgi:hypothetical protein